MMINKYEIALKYYPKASSKKSATKRLINQINRCKPLLLALRRAYYSPREKTFTPRQVKIIYEFLGEPDEEG